LTSIVSSISRFSRRSSPSSRSNFETIVAKLVSVYSCCVLYLLSLSCSALESLFVLVFSAFSSSFARRRSA
jgi:hypothetical protein